MMYTPRTLTRYAIMRRINDVGPRPTGAEPDGSTYLFADREGAEKAVEQRNREHREKHNPPTVIYYVSAVLVTYVEA